MDEIPVHRELCETAMPTVGYTRNEGTYMTFLNFSKTMSSIGAQEQYMSHDKASPEHFFRIGWFITLECI